MLAVADATERVTMRHLLSHTAGWFGDYFDGTGWGDDALVVYWRKQALRDAASACGDARTRTLTLR